jgi:phosphoribosyl 1,2-cyclic phosphodiesterase
MPPSDPGASLCVLSSSSGGNSSLLRVHDGRRFRHILIDLGLSPRRTREFLKLFELSLRDIDAAVLTHMDQDHLHPGWAAPQGKLSPLRPEAVVLVHASHVREARTFGLHRPNLHPLAPVSTRPPEADLFSHLPAPEPAQAPGLPAGIEVSCVLSAHDEEGTASFRFALPGGRSLGFATDIGRVTDPLVDLFRGIDVLAIESNYCPRLQAESDRPEFLKRRIMGGAGHLSNHEAADAVKRIGPKKHVVFLHLSRQCNKPDLVAEMHAGAGYGITIADPDRPSHWVLID